LLRVLALNDVHQAKTKRGFADVYIRPPVEQYNILDFGAYQQIAEIGYRSAMEALGEWEHLRQGEGARFDTIPGCAMAGATPAESLTARLHTTLGELEDLLERMS
jgi:predicted acylesterase/phospholipase RssA